MNDHSPVLCMNDVGRTYGQGQQRIEAVKSADLQLHRGQTIVIGGASGSGKSTLLLMASAMLRPTRGSVELFGQNTCALTVNQSTHLRATRVGVILPMFDLVPYLNALDNVCLAASASEKRLSRERATSLLRSLGMERRLNHKPSQMSAGEQRRVLVARGLINRPELLCCDEPTANLDEENAGQIRELLNRQTDDGTSLLIVTHESSSHFDADQVWRMESGELHLFSTTSSLAPSTA